MLRFVGGVTGLALQILPSGGRSWILRVKIGEKRRDIGLGGYPDVSLAEARDKAREIRSLIEQGIDPIQHRKRQRSALVAEQKRGLTFAVAVERFMKRKAPELSNDKHKEQWFSTLRNYAVPELGDMLVDDITTQDVLLVLKPIWEEKTETASRLRSRIEMVLSWAQANGHRTGDNPAKWGGNLKELLPSPAKIKKVTHRPAVAVADVQAWFASLRKRRDLTARALELLILCCCRSIEVRLSVWEEFDFDRRIWTVPAQRMKTRVEHRIPLTNYAVSLLKAVPHHANSPYVFAAPQGRALHDDDLSGLMRSMHASELKRGTDGWLDPRSGLPAVPHGLRSTFRDWAAENNYPREISEMALAHKTGSDVERAYQRSDLLERRRQQLVSWNEFLHAHPSSSVVEFRRRT
ncbi:integrase [Pseudovibrio japonicus]|uniref:Integrase n=2 Tax=Pseudovibrio japonicus TaxID=366534 RepID=A0ABQ3EAH1_9HYPH|nr:integrase [Pseudovibrio japonicus]